MRRHLAGAVAIAMERMVLVLPNRTPAQSRRRVVPIHAEHEPSEFGRCQLRNPVLSGRGRLRERNGACDEERRPRTESGDASQAYVPGFSVIIASAARPAQPYGLARVSCSS